MNQPAVPEHRRDSRRTSQRSENREADAGDGPGPDDDQPPAAGSAAAASVTGGNWPVWEFNSFTTRRSFIDDMASRNEPYRPDW